MMCESDKVPSDMLAAEVVVYRLLGINKDRAIAAMQELSKREAEGDDFDYQSFINEKLAMAPDRPKLGGSGLSQLGDLLKSFAGGNQ
jgi:hypothetical protein